jgi:hypothetical protein
MTDIAISAADGGGRGQYERRTLCARHVVGGVVAPRHRCALNIVRCVHSPLPLLPLALRILRHGTALRLRTHIFRPLAHLTFLAHISPHAPHSCAYACYAAMVLYPPALARRRRALHQRIAASACYIGITRASRSISGQRVQKRQRKNVGDMAFLQNKERAKKIKRHSGNNSRRGWQMDERAGARISGAAYSDYCICGMKGMAWRHE